MRACLDCLPCLARNATELARRSARGDAFRAAFASADLIVAKGQANFETMSDRTDKPIAFLFLAKCPVVCREVGARPQTIQVVLHNF